MKKLLLIAAGVLVLLTGAAGWYAGPHLVPISWTSEPGRLAEVLQAREGSRVAEIGAGSGAMALHLAAVVGREGRLFVTEIAADKRQGLSRMMQEKGLAQVSVIEAGERGTNLTAACCSAIYMRNVLHHIADWEGYARDMVRTLQPGGIAVIIDFAPGAFFHLADDHGADPGRVMAAFGRAGFTTVRRDDRWNGQTYMLAFRRP